MMTPAPSDRSQASVTHEGMLSDGMLLRAEAWDRHYEVAQTAPV